MRFVGRTVLAVTLVILASAGSSAAQVADKKVLTLDGAKKVAAAAAADARQHNEGAAIAIVDDGGNLLYLERLDDTFAAGARISIGKARTAALFKKPTAAFEEIIRNGRTSMIALEDFTPLQGGVPIDVDGKVVGAIGVSGAANQQRDEDVAKAGAAALR
jgi:glc operon protein GlcG